ncbi:unnamed protein product [Acanthoscelides obtectus]|uniref:Uncharacterized protein n=1 Tax=Acanthoscelides obtectus TaxID=200917 RepID=A0A9P0JY23_ACAOB|nr:unnamed protein product [Acanthoscelides obtectus]CAK1631472.1 hypothetical protein AOBTE_LOCUS6967 [Acanthoscelides obtectus]
MCSAGASINKEVKSASMDILERLAKISVTEEHKQNNFNLHESLSLLVHFLTLKAPSITAGKYFQLDYTLIFTLLASTYYYVAIFIQFK